MIVNVQTLSYTLYLAFQSGMFCENVIFDVDNLGWSAEGTVGAEELIVSDMAGVYVVDGSIEHRFSVTAAILTA